MNHRIILTNNEIHGRLLPVHLCRPDLALAGPRTQNAEGTTTRDNYSDGFVVPQDVEYDPQRSAGEIFDLKKGAQMGYNRGWFKDPL
jgi:hypothetical protein